MKNKTLWAVLGLLLLIGLIVVLAKPGTDEPGQNNNGGTATTTQSRSYTNTTADFSFTYPATYFVTERTINTAQRGHWQVILAEDTEVNRQLLGGTYTGPAREGPPTITFDIYQNNLDNQTVEQWIRNTSESNFKMGPMTLASTTVATAPALEFTWSGLYEGNTVVFAHNDHIIAAAVAYLTPNDPIRTDFRNILQSIRLQ